MLIELGNKTSLVLFAEAALSLSLFKQDDLKSFILNSGNAVVGPSIDLKKREKIFRMTFHSWRKFVTLTLYLVARNSTVLTELDVRFQL